MWKAWGYLLPVLTLALVLRLAWALLVPVVPLSDSAVYDLFARDIAAGRGYQFPDGSPTVYWPVGPSALYGLFYRLLGADHAVVAAVNVLLGVLLVGCTHLLALQKFGRRTAVVTGLLLAVWPLLIQFTTVLNSELPFLLFIVAALLVRGGDEQPHWLRIAVSALFLVLASFMRPTALPLVLLLPMLDFLRHRKPRQFLLHLGLGLGVAAALIGPWAYRNQQIFGAPVLISANFGANLWMGNNPASDGAYMDLPEEVSAGGLGEVARDELLKERALDFITSNPVQFLKLCAARIYHSFSRETIGVAWNEKGLSERWHSPMKLLATGYWLGLLLLSVIGFGIFVVARDGKEPPILRLLDPLVVVPAMFAAIAILIVGQDRYHMPMIPFVALFAALALARFASRRRQRTPG